jgi:hypothetical protein
MKLCSKILAIAIIAFTTYAMVGCAAPAGYSYQNISVSVASYCSDCGSPGVVTSPVTTDGYNTTLVANNSEGGCALFTATVTNAPPIVSWALFPTPNLTETGIPSGANAEPGETTPQVGTMAQPNGLSNYYCQNGVPNYTGLALAQANALAIPPGDVMMTLSVPSDPSNPSAVFTHTEMIQIYFNSNIFGPPATHLIPSTSAAPTQVATVPHGTGSVQFTGYAVGSAPCTPSGLGSPTCTAVAPATVGVPSYSTNNTVDWYLGYYNSSSVLTGTTNACTFTLATPPTAAQITACTEGYIVVGNTVNGITSATYYAPAIVPASTATSGEPVVVLESDSVPTVTSNAYVWVY